jgi:CelD/BcsL family acetyltransferase involved in cellulose biosynthesis
MSSLAPTTDSAEPLEHIASQSLAGCMSQHDVRRECQPLQWHVDEYHDLASIEHLRSTWNRLAAQSPHYSHFLTFDWLATYWKHQQADQQLKILIVRTDAHATAPTDWANETIVGIVPLVIRREATQVGSIRVLTYPLHGWGSIYSPLGACPDLTLHHALRYLASCPRDYDLLDLRWVDNRQGLGDLTQSVLQQHGLTASQAVWFDTYQVDLSSGWDAYWQSRTSHWRTNVRSNLKKLANGDRYQYIRYRPAADATADPRWDLYESCVELAAQSWQGQRQDGTTLSHQSVCDYLRDAHLTATHQGMADINLLYLDQRPVAFAYNYVTPGYVYGIRAGYDPAFRSSGVGTTLMYHMLRDSAERGDQIFDLGPGNYPSKQNWVTDVVPCYRYTHYPRGSWKAWALWLKHRWSAKAASNK